MGVVSGGIGVVIVVVVLLAIDVGVGNVWSGVVVKYSCVRLCLSNALKVAISCGNSDFRRNNWDLPLPICLLAYLNFLINNKTIIKCLCIWEDWEN